MSPRGAPRRVAITGMGAVACIGANAAECWRSMREGRSGLASLDRYETSNGTRFLAGAVRGFDPAAHFEPRRVNVLDRVSQLALVAAREAAHQSGIPWTAGGELNESTAVLVGTGIGGEETREEQSRRLYGQGATRLNPMAIVRVMPSAPASHVSIEFGLHGPVFAVTSACASANHAIAQAFLMVRDGHADAAIAGGTEACLSYSTLKAWEAMHVMADDACRPFSAQRKGMVLAEGAGMYVLETLDSARARGATVLAEIVGCGMSADAGDVVFPSEVGAARAMSRALALGELNVDDIDYINAHGTGTRANDVTETRAIRRALGTHADKVSVSSTKSVHGHALGAAGALELVAAIQAVRTGIVPPTASYLDADPECDLDVTPNTARERNVRAALSNSFAFGGLNCVLALRQSP